MSNHEFVLGAALKRAYWTRQRYVVIGQRWTHGDFTGWSYVCVPATLRHLVQRHG